MSQGLTVYGTKVPRKHSYQLTSLEALNCVNVPPYLVTRDHLLSYIGT